MFTRYSIHDRKSSFGLSTFFENILAGDYCMKCPESAKPENSHFVEFGINKSTTNNCTFECDASFLRSASNLCLSSFTVVFQIQISLADFLQVQNVYGHALASAAGSSSGIDPRDISFGLDLVRRTYRRSSLISIRAVILVEESRVSVQELTSSFTVAKINEFLPNSVSPILGIVVYGFSQSSMVYSNSSSNNTAFASTGKTANEQEAHSQMLFGLTIGLPLAACFVLFSIAFLVRRKLRTKFQTTSTTSSVPPAFQPRNSEAEVVLDFSQDFVGQNTSTLGQGAAVELSSDVSCVCEPELLKLEQQDTVKQRVRRIDFKELDVRNEISQGSFKSVYKAIWINANGTAEKSTESTGLTVAVLVLRLGGGMAREIEVFETLGCHPHLTRLLAVTVDPSGRQCLVTEFASRGSLDHVLHELADLQRDVSNLVLLTVCMQICEGMEVLSEHRLIHRDLAARNVLVFGFHESNRRDVVVKITDYGLTIEGSYVQLSTSSINEGIPIRWMPPEVRPCILQIHILCARHDLESPMNIMIRLCKKDSKNLAVALQTNMHY